MMMQLIVGVPLELSQTGWLGTLHLLTLYTCGVLLGSVLGSLFPNPESFLAGASSGVYALIAAHLATLVINWREDGLVYRTRKSKSKPVSLSLNHLIRSPYYQRQTSLIFVPHRGCRLAFIVSFTVFDLGTAVVNYSQGHTTSTSYSGHLSGALAGVLLGLALLENRRIEWWENKLKRAAIALYLILLLVGLLVHIVSLLSVRKIGALTVFSRLGASLIHHTFLMEKIPNVQSIISNIDCIARL